VALGRFLNSELIGLPFEDLVASLERRLLSATDAFYHLARRSLSILEQALATEPHERLVLEGTSYVVAQPEFQRDPEKAHQFLRGLEAHDALLEQLRSDLSTGKVRVRIGGEVRLPGCDTCSYVAAPLVVGQTVVGGIGVLGPTRMDYRQVSAMVDGMARLVNVVLSEGGRG
jgi:heat-inducible transcriptional repressor